jgi:hypothetical protein
MMMMMLLHLMRLGVIVQLSMTAKCRSKHHKFVIRDGMRADATKTVSVHSSIARHTESRHCTTIEEGL